MWIEKTNIEKAHDALDRRNKTVRKSVMYWLFFTVFPPLVRNRYLGGMVTRPHVWQLPLSQIVKIYAATTILSAVGVYFFYWRPRMYAAPRLTLLCPKCGATKFADNVSECQCGGYFVDLKNMKWVEVKGHN